VLVGVWAVYTTFGLLITLNGTLVPQIREDLGLSRAEMGVVLGGWQFVYILTAIPAGRVVDKLGTRVAVTGSALVMLGTAALRTTATGFWSLLIPVAAFGIGAPIISVAAPKVAASLFEGAARRRAVGVYGTAPAIGGVIAFTFGGSVVAPLVDDDWRAVTLIMTAAASSSLLVWWFVSRGLDDLMAPDSGPALRDYARLARRPIVAFVLLLSALNFFAAHGIGQWLVAMLDDVGWSTSAASLWAAAGTTIGLIAALVVPRFATPDRRARVLAVVLGSGVVGAALLLTTSSAQLAFAIGLTALPRVVIMPILSMILMDHDDVGPTHIAAASGLFFSIAQIGGVAGPAMTGAVSDRTGGFGAPLTVHSGVWILMAVLLLVGLRRLAPTGSQHA